MPVRRPLPQLYWRMNSPMTLGDLCLERIALTLLQSKINKTEQEEVDSSVFCSCVLYPCMMMRRRSPVCVDEKFFTYENPFVTVPSSISEKILHKIVSIAESKECKVSKNVFTILLQRPLRRLELSLRVISSTDLQGLWDTIKQTQTGLSVLKFRTINEDRGSAFLNVPYLTAYIRGMHSLTQLELGAFCDDRLLEEVGVGCPHLTHLEVRSEEVTSKGVKSLCLNVDDPQDLRKRCQKLDTAMFWVTRHDLTEGFVTLLLHLPHLAVLKCFYNVRDAVCRDVYEKEMAEVFRRLHEKEQSIQLNIQEVFHSSEFPVKPVVLANMCPHLKVLVLHDFSIADRGNFPGIATLRDVTFRGRYCNWNDGIRPFLQENGKFLEVLRLWFLPRVVCTVIDEMCTNLKKLTVEQVIQLGFGELTSPIFAKLESLHVRIRHGRLSDTMVGEAKQLVSRCHNLSDLRFHFDYLTEADAVDIISGNPFHHLNSIALTGSTVDIQGKNSYLAILLAQFLDTVNPQLLL